MASLWPAWEQSRWGQLGATAGAQVLRAVPDLKTLLDCKVPMMDELLCRLHVLRDRLKVEIGLTEMQVNDLSLDGFVFHALQLRRATARGSGEGSPPDPAVSSGTESERAGLPESEAHSTDPIVLIRKQRPRARLQIALVEYMKDRETAAFQDIGHYVHGDDRTADDAIRQNVTRTVTAAEKT
jgi:hypothetical protein